MNADERDAIRYRTLRKIIGEYLLNSSTLDSLLADLIRDARRYRLLRNLVIEIDFIEFISAESTDEITLDKYLDDILSRKQ